MSDHQLRGAIIEKDEGEILEGQSITPMALEAKIKQTIPDVLSVKAIDESDGCGAKFVIEIVSSSFKGKPKLQQHRMVHKAIEEERKSIHALTLVTKAEP